jgi:PIN domain nuclease of toxin-antitoxin system
MGLVPKSHRPFPNQRDPISARIATLAPEVDVPHSDPADRIIIVTAIENQLTVISPDFLIKKYPK